MADDWKPGDLALCVRTPVHIYDAAIPSPARAGGVYQVEALIWSSAGTLGLRLCGIVFPGCKLNASAARNYRKIKPLTDEEREAALNELREPVA